MYPIRTTTNDKNVKSTQNIKPKTAAATNTATQQPQTRSYPTQSNHRNSAAKSNNTNRRKSIGCSVVANLHKTQHKSSAATPRAPRNSQQPPQKQQQCITWPLPFLPQHDTAPLLDNAQECACKTSRHIPTPPFSHNIYILQPQLHISRCEVPGRGRR
jgi:hypothetical protein